MLKSIGLENFKTFKKLDNFELNPLTVLCGTNSSGKSTIIKTPNAPAVNNIPVD